jgi:hypothetical protein
MTKVRRFLTVTVLAIAQNLEQDDDGALVFRLYELMLTEKFLLGDQ